MPHWAVRKPGLGRPEEGFGTFTQVFAAFIARDYPPTMADAGTQGSRRTPLPYSHCVSYLTLK